MLHEQDISVVVGVDEKTLEQLAMSHKTWKRNCPGLYRLPWFIFYDDQTVNVDMIMDEVETAETTMFQPWSTEAYGSQREAMLTGFVFATANLPTAWWMKIDTDAVCTQKKNHRRLIEDEWFDTGEKTNAWIASSWSYTKAKGDDRNGYQWADALERWGDQRFNGKERLDLASKVDGQRISYPRMASWISFYNTAFTRYVAEDLQKYFGGQKLPVPSQDTVHWYAAERLGLPYVKTKFKRRGWTNHAHIGNLRAAVAEICG